ncbi:MAG: hypothetical protein QXU40_02675 [Candidatus Pacearchaeota archaeon]
MDRTDIFRRFKGIFGKHVFSKNDKMIEKEIILKGSILNEFVSNRQAG